MWLCGWCGGMQKIISRCPFNDITIFRLIYDDSPHLFRFIHRKSKRRRFKRSPHGPMFVTGHELIDDTGDIAYDVAHKSLDVTSGQQHHSWSRYAHKYVWFDLPVNNAFHCRNWIRRSQICHLDVSWDQHWGHSWPTAGALTNDLFEVNVTSRCCQDVGGVTA